MNDDIEATEPADAEELMLSVLRRARAHAQPEREDLASAFDAMQQRLRQPESPRSPSAPALARKSEARGVASRARLAGRARIIGWSALVAALGFWLGTRYERGLVSQPTAVPAALTITSTAAPAVSAAPPVSEAPAGAIADEPSTVPELAAPAAFDTPASARSQKPAAARPTTKPLDFRQVLELLRRAERARQAGAPELALALLDEIERGAARDVLREERLVTRTLALCDQGDEQRARVSARELGVAEGHSIYTSRLSQSCARAATPELEDHR